MGHLGRPDDELRARLDTLVGHLPLRVRTPDLTLWSSAPTVTWRGRERWGVLWSPISPISPISPTRPVTTWVEASEGCEATGVEIAPAGVTLHAASLGMQPLYVRQVAGALVFAQRLEDLVQLIGGALHADWTAWASIATFGSPLGRRTTFEEITRMPGGAAWHYDTIRHRLSESRRLPSALTQAPQPATPDDIVELLRNTIESSCHDSGRERGAEPSAVRWLRRTSRRFGATRARSTGSPWSITLSGGWDSRLLARCATQVVGSRQLTAHTTSPDDGHDLDLALSPPVAKHLGIGHKIVEPEHADWPAYAQNAFHRTEYQTPHHIWLEPLASRLRATGATVLDGLAGDVLLKNLKVDERALAARNSAEIGEAMWASLAKPPATGRPWVGEAVSAEFTELVRPEFDADREPFSGHPAEAVLTVLFTRTARCISLSPFTLFAPEATPRTPFLDAGVLSAALSVPLVRKAGGGFYRECLRSADHRLAEFPSTNDDHARPRPSVALRSSSAEAIGWAREVLTELADRQGRQQAEVPDPATMTRTWGGRTWLHTLLLLGTWLRRYEHRLDSTRAPWW